MRILYPIEGEGGGAVTHVLGLARELKKRQIFTFVAFLTNGPSVSVAKDEGLAFATIQKRYPFDLRPLWRLMRFVKKQKIDIVHTHTIRGNYYGRLAARLCGKSTTCITTVHSHIVDELKGKTEFGFKEQLLAFRERLTWRFVHHFICVSRKIQKRLWLTGIPVQQTTAIENAVDAADLSQRDVCGKDIRKELDIGEDDIVVGIVGRLVPLKNHDLFLRSAGQLTKRISRIRFLIVGDGPLRLSLVKKTRELGLDKHVIFTGWRNDVQRILLALDVFVICSVVEGLNVSVLEAMACAKPVVGTNVKGISEIILHDESGLLVASDDLDALTEAVFRLAGNRGERLRMGLRGRALIEKRYSVPKMVDSTLQVYRQRSANILIGGDI